MSKSDFPLEEFAARLHSVRRAVADAELDWLLVFHPVDILWLTGSEAKGYQAFQCLLVAAHDRPLVMLSRGSERAELLGDALIGDLRIWGGPHPEDPLVAFSRLAQELGLHRARVGMTVPPFYLHSHHYERLKGLLGSALVAEPTNLVTDLRLVKSQRELEYLRRAAVIADRSVDRLRRALAVGRSELEVAAEVYHEIMSSGGGIGATPMNFVSGERASYSHGAPTERKLRAGNSGNLEYPVPYRRYTVTIGRQFCLGPPAPRVRELFDIVEEASAACMAEIRDGISATVPHEAAKRVIARAELDPHRVHISGYAIAPGFPPAAGEPLHLFDGSSAILKAGMVLSVCPPIFIAEEGLGARLLDNVLVTSTGAERLCRTPRALIIID